MADRRSLVEGIKTATLPIDPRKEQEFVFRGNGTAPTEAVTAAQPATPVVPRSPVSTRIRTDYAAGLKRASLERQLKGIEPSTLQDILEEAIEPWLRANGYLP